jgi:uncharacterized cupin superfamily protein
MKTPIKFSKTGPEGWMNASNVALETTKLIEGTSKGLDHVYYENKETEVTSGIWRSSAYTEWFDDYPCDEFMYVLEGHVILENDEFCEKYEKGDAFLVPKGFKGYWKQPVSMLKFYVIIK